jgi:hypothetical protein
MTVTGLIREQGHIKTKSELTSAQPPLQTVTLLPLLLLLLLLLLLAVMDLTWTWNDCPRLPKGRCAAMVLLVPPVFAT